MATFTTSRFGDLVLESDGDGFVRREIAVNGRTATCSLFVNGTVPVALLGRAAALVDTLDLLDARARDSLRSELAGDTDVASFLQFHLDELSASELHERFGDDLAPSSVLAALDLVGVAVHGKEATFEVVLDYSVGRALSDQLLAVRFDDDGQPRGVSHES